MIFFVSLRCLFLSVPESFLRCPSCSSVISISCAAVIFVVLSSDCLLVFCCYVEVLRYLGVTSLICGGSRIFCVCFAILFEVYFFASV